MQPLANEEQIETREGVPHHRKHERQLPGHPTLDLEKPESAVVCRDDGDNVAGDNARDLDGRQHRRVL